MKDIKTYILESKDNIVLNAFLAFNEDPDIDQETDKTMKLFFKMMKDSGYDNCEFDNPQDGNDQTLDIYNGSSLIDSIAFMYAHNGSNFDEIQLWFKKGHDEEIMDILGAKEDGKSTDNEDLWVIKNK